tara:strand:+ start:98 stop:232 length:135 start_codon:yes stop_codon:yes gene_type:complete
MRCCFLKNRAENYKKNNTNLKLDHMGNSNYISFGKIACGWALSN